MYIPGSESRCGPRQGIARGIFLHNVCTASIMPTVSKHKPSSTIIMRMQENVMCMQTKTHFAFFVLEVERKMPLHFYELLITVDVYVRRIE